MLLAATLAAISAGAADASPIRFSQRTIATVQGVPSSLVAANFDRLPATDVVVGVNRGVFENGGVESLVNRGDGFEVGPFVVGGIAPYTIGAGDIDADGDLDVATPNTASDDLAVYENDGDGTFEAPLRLAAQALPRGIAVADFNGDGRADIATSVAHPDGGSASLLLFYRNAANTGFDPAVAVHSASPSDGFQPLEALVATDIDADGLIDLAGVDEVSGRLIVSFGTHDAGRFAAVIAVAEVDGGPIDLAAGDLNGDGRTDFATAGILEARIAILLRAADSGFAPPEYIDLPGITSSVVIADLDGDRRTDVAATLLDAGSVAVILRRKNNRGFKPPLLFGAGGHPLGLAASDMDSDGDTDLVMGDRDTGEIRLFINRAKRPR